MLRRAEVLQCVLVSRLFAAADVAAGSAQPKMDPRVAVGEALFASRCVGAVRHDEVEVRAFRIHRRASGFLFGATDRCTDCFRAPSSIGSFRTRLPVAAKTAFVTAATTQLVPASPIPPGGSALFTMLTSTAAASFLLTSGYSVHVH